MPLSRVTQLLNSNLEVEPILAGVLAEAVELSLAERGFLVLVESPQLRFLAGRNRLGDFIAGHQVAVSHSIIAQVAESHRPLLAHDACDEPVHDARSSVKLLGLRSILCLPLTWVPGVLYLDSGVSARAFEQADMDMLASLAGLASLAIQRSKLLADLHLATQKLLEVAAGQGTSEILMLVHDILQRNPGCP